MIVARWNKDLIFHVVLPGKEDPVHCSCMLHGSLTDPEIVIWTFFNFFWNAYNLFPRYLVQCGTVESFCWALEGQIETLAGAPSGSELLGVIGTEVP